MSFEIRQGDVLERLTEMPDCHYSGCLTDPPYGLSFMGKAWDHGVPGPEVWTEVLRILKPGAFLLAFGGTRTHHRLMCAIEDAGFEIRDMMMWVYGQGWPKSMNISKAIDRQAGAEREVTGPNRFEGTNGKSNLNCYGTASRPPATAPATAFDGFGTALKPAYEPIILGMKSLDGTFADNALKHGVAGLNIDGSRIGNSKNVPASASGVAGLYKNGHKKLDERSGMNPNIGRWPANIILDEESAAMFPDAPGQLADASTNADERKTQNVYGAMKRGSHEVSASKRYTENGSTNFAALPGARRTDSGSASRFFYCAKASADERKGNNHPTVKPVDLCRYLAKLMLPPEGETRRLIVPYSGSGSEMMGADIAGWDDIVGIEREHNYIEIANSRLNKRMPLFA